MSKCFLLTLILCSFTVIADDKKLSAEDFLYRVRHPAGRKRWAIMDGSVRHRRRGKETIKANLYLALLFKQDRTLAQVVIDKKQGYRLGQTFAGKESGTTIIPLNKVTKENPILGNFGLRPQDLTMTFIYWKFVKEFPQESIKMISCRVFSLKSLDDKEIAKVWISKNYYFPLKVQWTKIGAKAPFRSLEINSFKRQGNYGSPKRMELYGPDWRTKINFIKSKIGTLEQKNIPKDLFLKLLDE